MNRDSFSRSASATINNLAAGEKITVTGLRITFDIIKSAKAAENRGNVTIYNLSPSSRDLIQSRTAEGKSLTTVELRAGYKTSEEKILFRGTGEAVSEHSPPNWMTKINAQDGVQELKEVNFEKKYPAGTSVAEIVKDLVKAAGLAITVDVPWVAIIPKARTFSGDPVTNIQDLQSTYGFVFNVQAGGAILAPEDAPPKPEFTVTLSRETGMIKSPRLKGDLLIVDALIDPDLRPNNYVQLETLTPGLSGLYLIKKARYKGDTWQGSWTVSLEMELKTLGTPLPASFDSFGSGLA